jgi:hypothetical protein
MTTPSTVRRSSRNINKSKEEQEKKHVSQQPKRKNIQQGNAAGFSQL